MGHDANSYFLDSKSSGHVYHPFPSSFSGPVPIRGCGASRSRPAAGQGCVICPLLSIFQPNVKETHEAVKCYRESYKRHLPAMISARLEKNFHESAYPCIPGRGSLKGSTVLSPRLHWVWQRECPSSGAQSHSNGDQDRSPPSFQPAGQPASAIPIEGTCPRA